MRRCRECKAYLINEYEEVLCLKCSFSYIQRDKFKYRGTVNPKFLSRGTINPRMSTNSMDASFTMYQ